MDNYGLHQKIFFAGGPVQTALLRGKLRLGHPESSGIIWVPQTCAIIEMFIRVWVGSRSHINKFIWFLPAAYASRYRSRQFFFSPNEGKRHEWGHNSDCTMLQLTVSSVLERISNYDDSNHESQFISAWMNLKF